jgi:hypothetical protein
MSARTNPPDLELILASLRDYVEQLREEGLEGPPAAESSEAPRESPRVHAVIEPPPASSAAPSRAAVNVRQAPPPPHIANAPDTAPRSAPDELFYRYPGLEKTADLAALREFIGDCTRCKLAPKRTNLVFGVGNPSAELMFVGEAPGADEVAACEPFLFRQIDLVRPRVIVGLGTFAVQALLKVKTPISKLRGNWQEFRRIRMMPTFHPAYLLRNPADKRLVWADIQEVMRELGRPLPSRGARR